MSRRRNAQNNAENVKKKKALSKRLKRILTLREKVKILDKLHEGCAQTAVGRLFGINESTVRSIRSCEESIRKALITGAPGNSRIANYNLRNEVAANVENAVLVWLKGLQSEGNVVNSSMVIEKANAVYQELKDSVSRFRMYPPFSANRMWLKSFKRRFALTIQENTAKSRVRKSKMAKKRSTVNSRFAGKEESENAEQEDIWDDSELIQMYDEVCSGTYDKVIGEKSNTKEKSGPSLNWKKGDHCLAPYYEDNLWYPAVVLDVKLETDECKVQYDVYEDSAWVKIADITRPSENGPVENGDLNARKKRGSAQSFKSNGSRGNSSNPRQSNTKNRPNKKPGTNSNFSAPSAIIPPPPPVFSSLSIPTEEEALSSMLMSWYMNGYHTGYYQALQDMKRNT
ncbi:hypothetical protein AB6A40_000810 [Gnathostoma spinigerum]|uniref:Uncharacterized protein n=1 Tax=Gnathostoma spinigerum TaxID=75299 RepID=A0ABD6E4X9_9BILA